MDIKTLDQAHIPFRYDEPPPRNTVEAFWQWLVSKTLSSLTLSSLRPYPDVIPDCFYYGSSSRSCTHLSKRTTHTPLLLNQFITRYVKYPVQ